MAFPKQREGGGIGGISLHVGEKIPFYTRLRGSARTSYAVNH